MEILIVIAIVITVGFSANQLSRRNDRSRYDPLPKPPTSISRQYEEESPKSDSKK